MTRAIVLGPPGSGKGTQARLLASKERATHISVGALVRAEVKSSSEMGRRVEATVSAGDLIDFDDVIAVLTPPLMSATRAGGWILDGIPRTVDQAVTLDDILQGMDASPHFVISLEVPDDDIAARLLARASKEDRADDTEAVVTHRISLWDREGPAMLAWYEQQDRLTRIDGTGDATTVADRVAAATNRS